MNDAKKDLIEQSKKTKNHLLSDMKKRAAKAEEQSRREIMLAELVPHDLVPTKVHSHTHPEECLGTLVYKVDKIEDVQPIFEQLGSVPLIRKNAGCVSFVPEEFPGRTDRAELIPVNPVTYRFKPSWGRHGHNPAYAQPTDGEASWYTRMGEHLIRVEVEFEDDRITIAPNHDMNGKRIAAYKWVFCAPGDLFPVYRMVKWWSPENTPSEFTIYWERGTDG